MNLSGKLEIWRLLCSSILFLPLHTRRTVLGFTLTTQTSPSVHLSRVD